MVQPRWVQRRSLLSNRGGAMGMLDKFTAYSDETLEEMNSVSLIGGELSLCPY